MGTLQQLYAEGGQSPWVDNLRRDWLTSGELARRVGLGVRGVTSNPTIFAKAISGEADYDEQFESLLPHHDVDAIYWALVTQDITNALRVLRPIYDESDGIDGYVSLEVSPALAHDRDATLASARQLHASINQPNLLVKVPATIEGVQALEELFAEGHSINVTLIFGLERYQAVMGAYINGLERYDAAGGDLSKVASVASFFISRVDTEVDRRLDTIGTETALALRGKAAVAQAQVAYNHFVTTFSGARWEGLAAKGARVQRPLWASTSTKNPAYPDLLYVDSLIGPNTVNTMPEATLDSFDDHGTVARTIDADVPAARAVLEALADVGIDMQNVADVLEQEGVASFAKSFDELIQSLTDKANVLGAEGGK